MPSLIFATLNCQSGSIGSVVGNPFDVMKTKMMTDSQRPSLGSAMAQMYKDRGISGFYRGISVRVPSRVHLRDLRLLTCLSVTK